MCSKRGAVRAGGFTLIELMIALAVLALLAAVAYPSYQSAVLKSRRGEAKAALTDAAQRLERYYTENNRYTGASFCAPGDAGCTDASRVSGVRSENGFYGLDFDATTPRTATTFTIVATPQGAQVDDVCGSFKLDQTGERKVSGGSVTDPTKCW